MYNYDRTTKTALLSEGPVGQVLVKWWNVFHDLELDLKKAIHDYDWAASYDGPGQKEAEDMVKELEASIKALQKIAGSGGWFDDLAKAETKFTDKFGTPNMYVRQQAKLAPR